MTRQWLEASACSPLSINIRQTLGILAKLPTDDNMLLRAVHTLQALYSCNRSRNFFYTFAGERPNTFSAAEATCNTDDDQQTKAGNSKCNRQQQWICVRACAL